MNKKCTNKPQNQVPAEVTTPVHCSLTSDRRPPCQRIHPLVLRMPVVGRHPPPINRVRGRCLYQSLPQIHVLYWFFRSGFPAVFLPCRQPFGDAPAHVLAIRVKDNGAGPLEGR